MIDYRLKADEMEEELYKEIHKQKEFIKKVRAIEQLENPEVVDVIRNTTLRSTRGVERLVQSKFKAKVLKGLTATKDANWMYYENEMFKLRISIHATRIIEIFAEIGCGKVEPIRPVYHEITQKSSELYQRFLEDSSKKNLKRLKNEWYKEGRRSKWYSIWKNHKIGRDLLLEWKKSYEREQLGLKCYEEDMAKHKLYLKRKQQFLEDIAEDMAIFEEAGYCIKSMI